MSRLIGAVMLLAAWPVRSEEPRSLAEGTKALYRTHYEQAALIASRYLQSYPRTPAALILLARAEMAQGKYQPAYRELREALRVDPKNLDALYYLGQLCLALSQIEHQKLYRLAPDSARVHQLLAESFRVQGNTSKAEEEYQAALKANPRSVEVLDALGDLRRSQFRFDEAISYYSHAAETEPRDYDSAYGLGASYLFKHDPKRAIEHFRRALAVAPNSPAARLALGDALLRAGEPAEAVSELNAAIALEPDMRQAYTLLARAYNRLGQSSEAAAAVKKAQELTRKDQQERQALPGSDDLMSLPPPLPESARQEAAPDD